MRYTTDDLRIKEIRELTPPAHLIREFPCEEPFARTVHGARMAAHEILHGHDDRLLVIVGPCSIHDPKAAMEYAQKLNEERRRLAGDLEIIMRVYFEKPRTTIGWKGLMNDPDMDGSCRINHGLRIARELLCDIVALGLPTGVEYLDMITPQYIADLVSWGAIGAAEHSHSFLSVTKGGISAIVTTTGNEDCHIILRGGKEPNYDAQSVAKACEMLKANGHREIVMIDASHSNSHKICREQINVVNNICEQVSGGNSSIIGVMIESNLVEGNQKIEPDKPLVYGQSVTDACLGWDDTVVLLNNLAHAVRDRRSRLQ